LERIDTTPVGMIRAKRYVHSNILSASCNSLLVSLAATCG